MQSTTKHFLSLGGLTLLAAAAALLQCIPGTSALAQSVERSPTASTATAVIPQQVRYTGTLPSRTTNPVDAIFRIYATAEGGEALWTETQRVSASADGIYTVLLGAVSQSGLPQAVFMAGQARWVGVSVDGAEELPRSPLASVAYAMKAGDAESVGGVAAANLATKDDLAKLTLSAPVGQTQPQIITQPESTPMGSGTPDYVPLWTAAGTLGDSTLFQASSGYMGIGTTTPGGPLQLSTGAAGGANATMMLTQTNAGSGNYYADIGLYNSNGLIGNLSALGAGYPSGNLFGANDVVFLGGQQNVTTNLLMLTNTSGALKFGTGGYAVANERLRIGAAGGISIGAGYVGTDPGAGNLIVSGNTGIGTSAPAAKLEVNGTAKFDGLITFGAGQIFPGTGAGTISGITTTSPLTGSGTSGMVALSLNTSELETMLNGVYAQLGAGNNFVDSVTFDDGLFAAMSKGTGYASVTGNGTKGSTGVYGTSDTSIGVEGFSVSGTGVYGTSTSGTGGSFSTAAEGSAAVYASNTANYNSSMGYNPTALSGISLGTSSIGVAGFGTLAGVVGSSSFKGSAAVLGQTTDGNGGVFLNDGTDYSTVSAENESAGSATTSPMVFQALASGLNTYGVYSVMTGNGGTGLYGESDGNLETGSGRSAVGVKGIARSADSNGVVGDATGTGGYGVYAHASGGMDSTRYAAAGVYALADTGTGVEGFAAGQSATYNFGQTAVFPAYTAGVWGDTSSDADTVMAGIAGSADNNIAGFFENTSKGNPTIVAFNSASGGSGLFRTFKASTPAGTCGIGDGDLSCTGQVKTLATTGYGARTVETYATQSAENWMEDYGTGAIERGVGIVQIEPVFADTVTADSSYHVFLTPRGDSPGHLYITNVTATSFEVRESGGGTSSIGFDYKIVAKRRGFETQRLVDVTDRFNAEQAETKRRMPTIVVPASKGVVEPQMVERPGSVAHSTPRPNVRVGVGSVAIAPTPRQAPSWTQKLLVNPVPEK